MPPPAASRLDRARILSRRVLAGLYLVAGILHLHDPRPFLAIMPAWVPSAAEVVLFTGICEIAGAIGLLVVPLRRAAGVMLALYALCVYPANIQHAINDLGLGQPHLGWAYHAPRLILQPAIIWWALFAGGVTNWPVQRRARP